MKVKHVLTKKEQKLEWIILAIALLSFAIIGKGVYNETHSINQDYILLPILLLTYALFFSLLGSNAFFEGNVLRKWMPFLFLGIKQASSGSLTEKSKSFKYAKILGFVNLFIGGILFILAVIVCFKPIV